MATIAALVREELKKSPMIAELGTDRLVNITAAAQKIQGELEKRLGRKFNTTTVSMAVRRALKESNVKKNSIAKLSQSVEISTKSNLFEVAVFRSAESLKFLKDLRQKPFIRQGEFLSIFEGMFEIVIFANSQHKKDILSSLKKLKISSKSENLAYVSVNWGPETKDIPGIYYQVTRELAMNSISIQSMHTIGAEMMLVLNEVDLTRAHQVILSLFGKP